VRALAPCSCQGQALGARLRGCQEIRTVNHKSPIPSFPRKREPICGRPPSRKVLAAAMALVGCSHMSGLCGAVA